MLQRKCRKLQRFFLDWTLVSQCNFKIRQWYSFAVRGKRKRKISFWHQIYVILLTKNPFKTYHFCTAGYSGWCIICEGARLQFDTAAADTWKCYFKWCFSLLKACNLARFFCKHVSRHRGMKVRYNKHVTNSRHNDMVAFGPVFDALFRKLHVENVWVPFFVNLSHLWFHWLIQNLKSI